MLNGAAGRDMDGIKRAEIDKIYRNMNLQSIPWNVEAPPDALIELVKSSKVKPCKTIDLGCGAGNYAVYLASIGFEVIGVDISPTAIKLSKENAKRKGVKSSFIVADVLGNLDEVAETFELEVDTARDTDVLMRKAGDLLSRLSGKLGEGRPSATGDPSRGATGNAETGGGKELRRVLESVEKEIRGPLKSVGGLAFMLAKSVDPESDEGRYVQFLLAETERLERALNGIGRILHG